MKVAIYTYPSPDSTRLRDMIMKGLKKSKIDYDDVEPDIVITIGGDGTAAMALRHNTIDINDPLLAKIDCLAIILGSESLVQRGQA